MSLAKIWEDSHIHQLITLSLQEDIGNGDHSSLASIPKNTKGSANMLFKEDSVVAGLPLAKIIFHKIDPTLLVTDKVKDGDFVKKGTIALTVSGNAISILSGERLVLNFIQRLSGIASISKKYADLAKPYNVKVLDTRKTTPGLRILEKYAVKTGGCDNHRTGLYDMIMLKDNHVDFCGGITNAIERTNTYLSEKNLNLKIEVETRNLKEVEEACKTGGIHRMMLDNFSPNDIKLALKIINNRFETEASGGITYDNLIPYLETGVDYISIGALTHSVKSVDISLKTIIDK